MSILDARRYVGAFEHIKSRVLPDIQRKADNEYKDESARSDQLERWWMHWRSRQELISAIKGHNRFLVCSRVTKRPIFVFVSSTIRPGDALQAFTFDDDYSFGILQSDLHWQWFIAKCSKLKSDFRYTTESVFDTFSWPQSPKIKDVDNVAEAGRQLRTARAAALENVKGGLRAVYRTLELPGKNPLKDAHSVLDAAARAAYGFSTSEGILEQLLTLNREVQQSLDGGKIVTCPGIPRDYPSPSSLVSSDCIQMV
jgi:hypothetical protein